MASTRAPRTTMPCSVSPTFRKRVGVTGRGCIAGRLVDSGLDDGVCQRDVAAAQDLLIGDQPLRARFVAMDAPFIRRPAKPAVGDVHVVGRPAHQADRVFGHLPQRLVPSRQIIARSGELRG